MNISIGISDWKICKAPDVLVTYALGSCIGICMYDKAKKIAGLSHIMLPDSLKNGEASLNRMKYADTAIPDMYMKILATGAVQGRISAKIAGGAVMFNTASDRFNIGERNIVAVKEALQKLKIPIIAQDVGLNYGRTVFFHSENGDVEIRSTIHGKKMI